jgi:hypothetical protein
MRWAETQVPREYTLCLTLRHYRADQFASRAVRGISVTRSQDSACKVVLSVNSTGPEGEGLGKLPETPFHGRVILRSHPARF